MERSAGRRLDIVSRHLALPPSEANQVLVKGGCSQEEEEEAEPVVIGGMVLDIHATSSIPPRPRTTTPGEVHYVLGGVARNIAECMSKLGAKPYMISATGFDLAGNLLLEHWISTGLSTEGIRKHQDIRTAVICNIFDTNGELAAAVASVEAIEKFLTPEWIRQFKGNIFSAPILMVDTNLNPTALEASCHLAAESNVPVWFEPVSVVKSRRIASVAKYVTFASPNEDELIAMANALSSRDVFSPFDKNNGKNCSTESLLETLQPAILVLLEKGIKIVIVTLGAEGVFLCCRRPNFMKLGAERAKEYKSSRRLHDMVASTCLPIRLYGNTNTTGDESNIFAVHFPSLPASVVRLTGAGDCLVGGTIASLCSGLDIMQSVAVGIAAAKNAVESETNVPSMFNLPKISGDAGLVYSAARVLLPRSML